MTSHPVSDRVSVAPVRLLTIGGARIFVQGRCRFLISRIAHEECEAELAQRAYAAVRDCIDNPGGELAVDVFDLAYNTTFGDQVRALTKAVARTIGDGLTTRASHL